MALCGPLYSNIHVQHLANAGSGENKSMIAYILANGEPCNVPYNKYWGEIIYF